MTEPTQPERAAEQSSTELPIPKLETPSPVSSPSSVDIDAIADKVAEKIQRDLRMAQSKKDKNAELIKKTYGVSDLSELEELGVQIPENVKTEYRFRQLEQQRTVDNSPTQQTPSPGNGAALSAQDVSEVVKNFNLDANTPEVLEALRGTYRNRDHFEATLARLAMAKANKPQPSAAESSSLASGAAAQTPNEGDLLKKLNELQNDPVKNLKEIREIKAKLKW